jgi:hypothetical protein
MPRGSLVVDDVVDLDEPGAAAFALCELEWMRKRVLSALACTQLGDFADAVGAGVGEAGTALVQRVRSTVEDVEELVISLGHRVAALPVRSVSATPDEVGVAAAAALEDGIADAERALHAARWIEVGLGLRALAGMLEGGDAFRFWDVSVARFVAAFRGSDRQLALAVASEAGVREVSFADLEDGQAARLAAVLRARSVE